MEDHCSVLLQKSIIVTKGTLDTIGCLARGCIELIGEIWELPRFSTTRSRLKHYRQLFAPRFSGKRLLIGLWSIILLILLIKYITAPQQPSYVALSRQCMHDKTNQFKQLNSSAFLEKMWRYIPHLVDICVYKKIWPTIQEITDGTTTIQYIPSKVWAPDHTCDFIFIRANSDLSLEYKMKARLNSMVLIDPKFLECQIHTISPTLPAHVEKKVEGIKTYPFKIIPKAKKRNIDDVIPTNPDYSKMDMLAFMNYFLRRHKIDGVVIDDLPKNTYTHLQNFFYEGAFIESGLRICQVNLRFPQPKTLKESTEFKQFWEKILYDRKYLLASARYNPTSGSMDIFLLNMFDQYCWSKYISLVEPFQ